MNPETETAISRIEQHLARIADALDADRAAPNYHGSLAAYPRYNWGNIAASVVESDTNGATRVMWHHHIFTRRSNPKYGSGVWFSRGAGRDDAGELVYQRLITFAPPSPVEPLPAQIAASIRKATSPAQAPTAKEKPAARAPARPSPTEAPTAQEEPTALPSQAEKPQENHETPRKRFFRLLPLAIAAGLAPDNANNLSSLARSTSYAEALVSLEQHIEQLEARSE